MEGEKERTKTSDEIIVRSLMARQSLGLPISLALSCVGRATLRGAGRDKDLHHINRCDVPLLQPEAIGDSLLPIVNFSGATLHDRFVVREVVKVLLFSGIFVQMIKLVCIFVSQAKLPSIVENYCPSRFVDRALYCRPLCQPRPF